MRQPLSGAEIRGCWEGWPAGAVHADAPLTIGPARRPDEPQHREFIEVGAVAVAVGDVDSGAPPVDPVSLPSPADDPGWSLWGDPDR